jgi:hypothetical protein
MEDRTGMAWLFGLMVARGARAMRGPRPKRIRSYKNPGVNEALRRVRQMERGALGAESRGVVDPDAIRLRWKTEAA